MRKLWGVLLVALAAYSPHAFAARGPVKTPDLKLTVTQSPDPAQAGREFELSIAIVPPTGITLNQYPGITLKIEKAPGLRLRDAEVFVGVRKPIEDPAEFPFKTIEPLKLYATPAPGVGSPTTLEGTLKFFYCVKASGYCAPGEMKVKIPVKLGG